MSDILIDIRKRNGIIDLVVQSVKTLKRISVKTLNQFSESAEQTKVNQNTSMRMKNYDNC